MPVECALCFACGEETLIGILHEGAPQAGTGVVVVVGGPQYRIGSHRQFVHLARHLAGKGTPVLRFDVRGMGDSSGDFPGFENLDRDIGAAVDALFAEVAGLRRVVLWGLCDAASAILFYAHQDPRVAGIALLNPWVRTEASHAKAQIRHYYRGKLRDLAFWRRLLSGQVDIGGAARETITALRTAFGNRGIDRDGVPSARAALDRSLPLPERMAQGLALFGGSVLLVMSGRDLTAREFADVAAASSTWRELLGAQRVMRCDISAADHTFARADWTEAVAEATAAWIAALPP